MTTITLKGQRAIVGTLRAADSVRRSEEEEEAHRGTPALRRADTARNEVHAAVQDARVQATAALGTLSRIGLLIPTAASEPLTSPGDPLQAIRACVDRIREARARIASDVSELELVREKMRFEQIKHLGQELTAALDGAVAAAKRAEEAESRATKVPWYVGIVVMFAGLFLVEGATSASRAFLGLFITVATMGAAIYLARKTMREAADKLQREEAAQRALAEELEGRLRSIGVNI